MKSPTGHLFRVKQVEARVLQLRADLGEDEPNL